MEITLIGGIIVVELEVYRERHKARETLPGFDMEYGFYRLVTAVMQDKKPLALLRQNRLYKKDYQEMEMTWQAI